MYITRPGDVRHPSACAQRAAIAAMEKDEGEFFPRGAVAFFAAMLVFYAGFWLLLMAIMVRRG